MDGADISKLSTVLATAIRDDTELEQWVYASTGDRLYVEYVARGQPLRPTLFSLLDVLNQRGIAPPFLRYAHARLGGRPEIQALIAELCAVAVVPQPQSGMALAAQTGGNPQTNAPTNANAPGLQRNVRPHLAKLDVLVWRERLSQVERRICMLEANGNAAGTGFLVGPDVVLTNWHVVRPFKDAVGTLQCRFDFLKLPNNTVQAGQLTPLHADGCLDYSSYSQAEMTATPDTPPPKDDELDYALLRLATRVGEQAVNGAPRGWIALPAAALPLPAGTPLLIVQHPQGQPMKLALDTEAVIGLNAGKTRVRYKTNTDPGSSGSPCFSMDWDIVALHHYGDPAWRALPQFNQGIPVHLINQRITAKGLGSNLGH